MKILGCLIVLYAVALFYGRNKAAIHDLAALTFKPSPQVAAAAATPKPASATTQPAAHIPRTTSQGATVGSSSARVGGGGGSYTPSFVQLGSDEIRKFDLIIDQVIPGGAALAFGSFYDISPEESTTPERMDYRNNNRRDTGEIYITGIGSGAIDGGQWQGWLVRTGTKTFTTVLGAYRTVPSYKVVPAPDPGPEKRGAWMHRRRGTMLD